MKLFIAFALALCLFACNKDCMESVPTHSAILINDEYAVSNCNTDKLTCLPVTSLDDIAFQILTDYDENPADANFIFFVVLPCQVCGDYTAQEVFDLALGDGLAVDSLANQGGFLKVTLTGHLSPVPNIGDKIFIRGSSHYQGYWNVTNVVTSGAGDVITTSAPFNVSGTATWVKVINTAMYIAGASPQGINSPVATSDGQYAWQIGDALFPTELNYDDNTCFRLCVYKITADYDVAATASPTFVSGSCIGATNCLEKVTDLCYTTKIKYQYNEDAMGFYGSPSTNSVRLPMYLSRPQYPGDETGYQTADGRWLKQAERVNKEWPLETDWIPDALHEKIRIALSADFIQVWNQNENLALEGVYRSEDYNIEWNEEVDYPIAKGKTTLKKRVLKASLNSNCV